MSAPSATSRLFASLILCALTACSFGTEVGNGVRPPKKDKGQGKKLDSAAPDQNDESSEQPTVQSGVDADTKTDGAGASDGADGDDEIDSVTQGEPVDVGPPSDALVDDALDAITAQCASVWYDTTLGSPLSLGTADQPTLLTATLEESTKTWLIGSDLGGTHVVRKIKPIVGTPEVTEVRDADDVVLAERFTCGDGGGWGDGDGNSGGFMDLHEAGSDAVTHIYWEITAPGPEDDPKVPSLATISVSRKGEGELKLTPTPVD
jgi:hypothetical protein